MKLSALKFFAFLFSVFFLSNLMSHSARASGLCTGKFEYCNKTGWFSCAEWLERSSIIPEEFMSDYCEKMKAVMLPVETRNCLVTCD